MLVVERQRKIVELVNERLSIRVSELSDVFNVTEETIRRDLERLEKEELLRRSHGGAVSIEKNNMETPYTEREILNSTEKKVIALEGVKLINPGDQIVLDASTTAWFMAKELEDMPLTVITNSIKVAIELSKKEHVKVISTGGMLLPKSLSYAGPLAERSLDNYFVNKAFISCKGVHLDEGLSDSNEWQALLKKKMLQIADKTILLADSSKFGVRTFVQIAKINQIDEIITDSKLSGDYINELNEKNINLNVVNRP
ncbi:DeoR/GlpR family DNA-binding transcription regulator [Peribacillus butanolivorans]|uniref:DeoR/GlpR family DNA-binding transcription regulator n=1 Tax=Peribacillus butanolivorans TaxID=421767 RepID=UPI00207C7A88|nr:DeoR/GlpR family DNA-binding transcription regulator [Peribacillus butanolivorans]MCO0597518.1 DeoR/GlpR family DNA-binding transcription regulator [Peribacillus butanolivorans]